MVTGHHSKSAQKIYGWSKIQRKHRLSVRNKVSDRITKKDIEKCAMIGDIFKMTYHRINQGTNGQDADKFETTRNSKKTQLTIIVPFMKLDVIIKSKKGSNYLINNNHKNVHCFILLGSCVILDKDICYCIPDNTAEIVRR